MPMLQALRGFLFKSPEKIYRVISPFDDDPVSHLRLRSPTLADASLAL